MWRRRIFLSSIFCAVAFAQPANRVLRPNSSTSETLAGTAEVKYALALPPDQSMNLQIIERQGLAGVVVVLAANGSELVEADLSERSAPAKSILIPPGAIEIRIRPLNHGTLPRIFELRTGEVHPVSEQDRLRIEAEQLLGEGERLSREEKEEYLSKALATQEKALRLWKRLSDPAHQATVLLDLAAIHAPQRNLKTALEECQAALALWTAEQDRSGMADAFNQTAVVELMQEQLKKADDAVSQAKELARAAGDSRKLAQALMIEGDIRSRQGKSDEALGAYVEALQLTRKDGDRLAEADDLSYLETFEHDSGHLQAAMDYGTDALAISKEEGDQKRTAYCLIRLSNVYASAGDFRKAISYGEEALPILKDSAVPFKYGNGLYNVASYYSHVDNYPIALKYYTEALGIFRKTGSALGQAYVLSGLAYAHLLLGDDEKADSYYAQTAAEFHEAENKQGEVLALLSLGGIAQRRRQFAKAIALEQQALTIARAGRFERPQELALGDLAESYFEAGDFRASAAQATEKLELIRKTGYSEEEEEANALRQQGRALRALHKYDDAQEALNKALTLYQAAGTRTRAAETLYELGAVDRDCGRLREASAKVATALDSLDATGAGAGSAQDRMLFAASHRKSYDLAIDLAMRLDDNARAFELSERARARTLVDLIRGARLDIRRGADPKLLEEERNVEASLDDKSERLTRLLASSHSAASVAQAKKEIEEVIDKYQNVEAEIRLKSPRYAALTEPSALSLDDVRLHLLDSRTGLLEFWLGEEHSYAWLVTRAGCRGFELPARGKIEELARRAYEALNARNVSAEESPEQRQKRINAADQEFARMSADLSDMLLKPVLGLAGVHRLWVVSDGALEYLPFSAFPLPGIGTPLISSFEIAQLPSASVLQEVRKETMHRPRASREVAVFADPVFQPDDERVSDPRTVLAASAARMAAEPANLPRLYFSRQEADGIVALDRTKTSLEILDFQASRAEAMNPALANYRVVHFATHIRLNSRHPELSAIVLSLVDHSGQEEDGFLHLHEIYNLKLAADLVVLSGCETALGLEVRSEGLVGLTRGFMYAGTPQVLASLWSVRDRATAELMRRFYEALLESRLAPAAALRSAQLAMRRDPRWSQPYYWAAFTMEGAR